MVPNLIKICIGVAVENMYILMELFQYLSAVKSTQDGHNNNASFSAQVTVTEGKKRNKIRPCLNFSERLNENLDIFFI